jgi:hypothetical protein
MERLSRGFEPIDQIIEGGVAGAEFFNFSISDRTIQKAVKRRIADAQFTGRLDCAKPFLFENFFKFRDVALGCIGRASL